ncbi:MAG: flippase-like domain-containing protein [Nitrospinae bacterium]|nr:flippase-like domain-containing protein [Nitrospinota bacterium]MZH04539.1 flippase-like domain-containing protein [Nitrospinota bacterium]
MKLFLNLALFLIGLGLLIWAVNAVDMEKTLELLLEMKFGFLAILGLYVGITWLDTLSWKFNFPPGITRDISDLKLWEIRTIGDAYNTITPLGTMGGEPVKAHLLREHFEISLKQTISSLIITRTTFLAALILFCVPGIFFIFNSSVIPADFKTVSLWGMVSFSIMIFLFFLFQVTGTLGNISQWFGSKTSKPGLQNFLQKLIHLDSLFSVFYRKFPQRVLISIFLAFLGWILGLGEVYLIFYFLGFSPSFIDIWIIEAMAQLVKAGSFFIPFSIGALEGGLVLIFSSLGYPPSLGLAASLVGRVKQLAWVALGLTLGWLMSFRTSSVKSESFE